MRLWVNFIMKKIYIFTCIALTAALLTAKIQAADWKTLHLNDTYYEVCALKLLLRHRNYDPGEIHNTFNKQTLEALVFFQEDNNLNPDGVTGPETWRKLITPVSDSKDLEGINDAVKAVQYLLINKYGFTALEVDGTFDVRTKAAILLFQHNYKLGTNGTNGMDGIAGEKTWLHLIQDSRKSEHCNWVICVELNKDRGSAGMLYVFDAAGFQLASMPCLGESMTMNTNWREQFANTPLGCFRAAISHVQRNPIEYGIYNSIELNDADVKAVTDGRFGILIHSGNTKFKNKSDTKMPNKFKEHRARTIDGLDQTHGCIRISDADHAVLYEILKNHTKGIVSISEQDVYTN